jgi:cobalt-zinc-cadmium efflux system outer membrane protein
VSTLTLERALALAEEKNPQLKVAAAQVEGARSAIRTASAYPNPQFNNLTGYQYTVRNRVGPAVPGLLQHYSFDQPLELPSMRRARIAAARRGEESSIYAQNEARLQMRAAVKQAYFEVLRREEEVSQARENLKLVEDLLRRVRVQVEVGEAARLELTRAEAETAAASTYVRSAQLRLVSALSMLGSLIGTPLDSGVDLVPPPGRDVAAPSLEQLKTEMLQKHPSLARARAEVERAGAQLQTQIAMRKPQPSVRMEWEHQPDLGFVRFGVSLPLPVWNKREGPIGEAVAVRTQMSAAAEATRLQMIARLEQAYGLYELASQQIASLERGVLREAEAAVSAAEAAFRFGERGIIEVLDAQRVLRTVRADFLNAQYDQQSALIELDQLRAIDSGETP